MAQKLALIAGNGNLPILFAQRLKEKGLSLIAVGLEGEAEPSLAAYVEKMHLIKMGELGRLIGILKEEGVRRAVLAGGINKRRIYQGAIEFDAESQGILGRLPDRHDATLLRALCLRLKCSGITLLSIADLLPELLAQKGVLTNRPPDGREMADIRFGQRVARRLARLDIGQTVVVKDKTVIALEGLEGTNEAILRAGRLVGRGGVVVKMARPRQDMRFDIPTIGEGTVQALKEARVTAVAVQAGKTLFLDKKQFLNFANESSLAVIAL